MANITKKALIDKIAETHQVRSITTKKIVQAFLDEIMTELANGNRLEFRDFGIFDIRTRKPREGQNPKTLEKVTTDCSNPIFSDCGGNILKVL